MKILPGTYAFLVYSAQWVCVGYRHCGTHRNHGYDLSLIYLN